MEYLYIIDSYNGGGYASTTIEIKSDSSENAIKKAKDLIIKDHYIIKKIQEVL